MNLLQALLSFTWISRATDHNPTVVTIEFPERGTGTEVVLMQESGSSPSR